MKRLKVLKTVTTILAILLGGMPGFVYCIGDLFIHPQDADGHYWRILSAGIPALIVGVSIGYLLIRFWLGKWILKETSIIFKSVIVLFCTVIAGILALMVAWETIHIIPYMSGWGFHAWQDVLDHYLLMLIYGLIPVGIAAGLSGIFSFLYLRFSK